MYLVGVEQVVAQMDDSPLHVPAGLSLHIQRSRPSWSLSALKCDACTHNILHTFSCQRQRYTFTDCVLFQTFRWFPFHFWVSLVSLMHHIHVHLASKSNYSSNQNLLIFFKVLMGWHINSPHLKTSRFFSFFMKGDILYRPHATSVIFAPQSSATSRGRSSSLNELCPSCPYWPEPNVNTTPVWGNKQANAVSFLIYDHKSVSLAVSFFLHQWATDIYFHIFYCTQHQPIFYYKAALTNIYLITNIQYPVKSSVQFTPLSTESLRYDSSLTSHSLYNEEMCVIMCVYNTTIINI